MKLITRARMLFCALLLGAYPLIGQASIEQGYAALANGESDRAIQFFQIAVRDNPDSIASKVGLARAYYSKRRIEDTEKMVQEVLLVEPGNLDAIYLKARIELRKGHPGAARDLLIEVVNGQPENVEAKRDLANILSELGETELADKIYGELNK